MGQFTSTVAHDHGKRLETDVTETINEANEADLEMLSSSTNVRREEDASQRVSGRIAPAEEPDHAVVEHEDLERHISTSTPDDEDGDIVGTLKDVDKSGRVNRSNSSLMPKPKTPMNLTFEDVCCYVPASFETPGILSTLKSLGRCARARRPSTERGRGRSCTTFRGRCALARSSPSWGRAGRARPPSSRSWREGTA